MKKLIFVLATLFAISVASCGNGQGKVSNVDTTVVDSDSVALDSLKTVKVDTVKSVVTDSATKVTKDNVTTTAVASKK